MFLLLFFIGAGIAFTPPKQISPWKSLPSLPYRVLEATGTLLFNGTQPLLILTGGYIEASNLNTTTATTLYPLPTPKAPQPAAPHPLPMTHMAHASDRHILYTCGGFLSPAPGISTKLCHSYTVSTDSWSRLPDLPESSGGAGMVYIKQLNALFYAGGSFRNGTFGGTDTGKSYMLFLGNLTSGWQSRAPMPNLRNHLAAVVASNRVFFLGGQKGGNEVSGNSADVREYLWWVDKWILRKSMPLPLGHVSASVFKYLRGFMVIGGITNGRELVDKIFFYDVRDNEWYQIGRFPRRVQTPVCAAWGPVFCVSGFGKPGWANLGYKASFSRPVRD